MDQLVGAIGGATDPNERAYLYFQLYFALNYWLRYFKTNLDMHNQREPAVRALFRFVVRELSRIFNCGVQAVPNILEDYFGREMSAHGSRIDTAGMAVYQNRARLEKWKLHYDFKTRKFCYLKNGKMDPAHSFSIREGDINKADLKEGYANFVLTMGGDIYMAPHAYNRTTKQSFFHSSYTSGQPVQAAGSILLTYGALEGLQNNSGHYQPTDSYMVNVLKHVQMLGHTITNKIKVWNYGGSTWTGAADFIEAEGNWEALVKRQKMQHDNWQGRLETKAQAGTAWRKLQHGTSLRTLVEERYQARPNRNKTWANIWDEVILDLMGMGGDYKGLYEKPAPRKPPVPKFRPWRKAAVK